MDNNMDKYKNINLTLMQPEEKDPVIFSFSDMLANAKRYFLIWIIASVVAVMSVSGFVMLIKTNVSSGTVTALVNFNYEGVKKGLDPAGKKFDVNKIKSPNNIESALTELNIPLSYVEGIRRNISIEGLYPEEVVNEAALYQEALKKGSMSISAVNTILDMDYYHSYYILKFNYSNTKFNLTESKQILDGILKSYQSYFFTTYGYNESLGNSVVAVDYTEYDYPTAIDVFDNILESLEEYVTKLANQTPGFRSGNTGYSFNDLRATIETIQTADIDSLSSYVIVNNVTNDKNVLLNYYEYKIEELKRNLNVYNSELDTISKSLDSYEKDSMVLLGEGVDSLDKSTYTIPSEKYDELINQKVNKQLDVSKCEQRIGYYDERVKALKSNNNTTTEECINITKENLNEINDKINNLIDIVNKTADEYYETVTFAHAYNILVPATGAEPTVVTKDIFLPVAGSEAIIFVIYAFIVVIKSIASGSEKSKENNDDNNSEDIQQ